MTSLVFLLNLSRVVFAPLVEPLQAALSADAAAVGLVVTLAWLGSALPRVPVGWLLTRVPRHRVVVGSGVLLAVASAFAWRADSVATLGAGALLMGLASGAYFVSANPLLSELYPRRVGRVMGLHGTASQVAAVLAGPLVTFVLVAASWRAVFAGVAVAATVVTAVLGVVAHRTEMPAASGADRNLPDAVRAQWRLVAVGVVVLGTTGFVWQGVFNFYVSFLLERDVAEPTARNVLTVVFLAGVPAFLVSGRLADRLPHVPYILAVLVAFVATLLAVTAAENFLVLLALTALLGYVIHSLFPAMDTFLLDTLPDEHRGGAYAVYSGGMMLTQAGGSSVVGALAGGGLAYATVFRGLTLALVAVVAGLCVLWAVGRFPGADRSTALRPSGD